MPVDASMWNWLAEAREVFFSELPIGDTEYKLIFRDIINFDVSPYSSATSQYWIFNVESMEDYPTLGIEKGQNLKLNLPVISFQKAFKRKYPRTLNPENIYDVVIFLKRETKKMMTFTRFEIADQGVRKEAKKIMEEMRMNPKDVFNFEEVKE